jgi:hypothetical protein
MVDVLSNDKDAGRGVGDDAKRRLVVVEGGESGVCRVVIEGPLSTGVGFGFETTITEAGNEVT